MRKTTLGLTAFLAITFSTSCQQAKQHDHGHDHGHDHANEHALEDEHAHDHENAHAHDDMAPEETHSASHGLVLDDGKKWAANAETTEGIHTMIEIMDSFTDTTSVEAYLALTDNLNEQLGLIFHKCTMTGEAHNQLHVFLMPIKATFAQLAGNDINMCRRSHKALRAHLDVYDEFFE